MSTEVLVKLVVVSKIFQAAKLLEENNLLQGRTSNEVVREYVLANPEINAVLKETGHGDDA